MGPTQAAEPSQTWWWPLEGNPGDSPSSMTQCIRGLLGLLLLLNSTRHQRRLGWDVVLAPVPLAGDSDWSNFPLHRTSTLIYYAKA